MNKLKLLLCPNIQSQSLCHALSLHPLFRQFSYLDASPRLKIAANFTFLLIIMTGWISMTDKVTETYSFFPTIGQNLF